MDKLTVNDLSVKYRYGALAVSDLSFSVGKGVLCVFGDTEAGKTSLFKTIAGIHKPVSGTICFDDQNVTEIPTQERKVCLLYEDGGFFERKTARYNLTYPLKIRKVPEEERENAVLSVAKKVGFDQDRLDVRTKRLTQEERILLAFARAYTHQSDLYLIDDALKKAENREEVFQMIKPFIEDFAKNTVVLYATDNVSECEELGGKILFLHYGIPMFFGTIGEIRKDPPDLTAVEKFCPNAIAEETVLFDEGKEFRFTAFEQDYTYDKKDLLSEVFLGKTVVAVKLNEKVLLYDQKSERRIFFLTA